MLFFNEIEEPHGEFFKKNNLNKIGIPLPYLLPKSQENKFFYENGLSKIIPRLKLKVHSDIEQCFYLWDKFSKKESLFDLWDFRYSWLEGYHCPLYFYTLYEKKNPLAVLPLWYDSFKKRFEWYGSNWMEDNYFFVEDEEFVNLLLKVIPGALQLNSLEKAPKNLLTNIDVICDDDKFIKKLDKFKTIDDYLATLEKKHRYNLKKDYQNILNLGARVEVSESNDVKEFDNIISISINRFSKDEESDLIIDERVEAYKSVIKNSGLYKTKFIKVYIQNYLAACDLIITHKDRYYGFKGANDVERFPGIGNFLVYFEFEDAIKNNYNLVDCLQIDYGWKHKYFDGGKRLTFEKDIVFKID